MSWNNVIPANLLISEIPNAKPIDNPLVTIPLDLLVYCTIKYDIEGVYGMVGSADHPAFAELRRVLNSRKYINAEFSWLNGDRVTKRFRFNGIQLEVGDKFYCAAAWQYRKKDMNNA